MKKTLLTLVVLILLVVSGQTRSLYAQPTGARALLEEAGKAMGGLQALKALKNQVVESEGKQFDSSSMPRPGGPTRQINTFRTTLTRDLTQPRL